MSQGFGPHHDHSETPHVTAETWRQVAERKRNSLKELIPAEWRLPASLLASLPHNVTGIPASCGILSAEELAITEEDDIAVTLDKLHSGSLSAVEVTRAYCKRASIAQQLVNCLTEIYFDDALKRAEELDDHFKRTGKTVGPLHGLPVSLKDQFDIEGKELTMGYASWLGRISKKSAAIVRLLIDAGAVIYVRTSVPQTLMHGETANQVFGLTVNPYHSALTPGGSSGGEGALLALKGSPLGVGTDIGGSVRIPAGFCGLYALRPSYHRIPYGHASNSWLGQGSIVSVIGPMSRSLSGLAIFFKAVLDLEPAKYDATALPFGFRPELLARPRALGKLSFGIIKHDCHRTPHPPIQRARRLIETALKKAGHEVIEFSLEPYKRIPSLNESILFSDAGQDVLETFKHIQEPIMPITEFGIDENMKPISVYELNQLNREKEHYQQEFLNDWLSTKSRTSTGRPIDGLISPIGPTTACQHGTMDWDNYTSIFNILDLPAVAFPVTAVNAQEDVPDPAFRPFSAKDKTSWSNYDANLTNGLPVGLQVIGNRWQEEAVLGLASVIADALSS